MLYVLYVDCVSDMRHAWGENASNDVSTNKQQQSYKILFIIYSLNSLHAATKWMFWARNERQFELLWLQMSSKLNCLGLEMNKDDSHGPEMYGALCAKSTVCG